MNIKIPELTLVALIGPSGSGKSTFARQHFLATEILSSDACRGLVSDDENNQSCSKDAFDVLYYIAAKRLAAGKLVVIDATNVRPEDRKKLLNMAREYHVRPSAIVFDLPEQIFHDRNANRPDRDFGPHVIRQQTANMRRTMRNLGREGFREVAFLRSEEEVNNVTIERVKLWPNKRDEHGPFDIIGDIHGCYDELCALLSKLGYQISVNNVNSAENNEQILNTPSVQAPQGRKAIFLGDLVDRGPKSPEVLKLVMSMVSSGCAIAVPGNHDIKLMRHLRGKKVQLTHGLAETVEQLSAYPETFHQQVADFIDAQIGHYVLDDGKLVVAHAGMKAEMQGRASGEVRSFALFGETTGETDEFGLPVRYNWAEDYRGDAMVVYGHTPAKTAQWINRTICIDTGCVFGGELTALRYPEREIISVPALKTYYEPIRPLEDAGKTPSDVARGQVLDIEDVLGKIFIHPRIGHSVVIRENQSCAALEVMSRFALDPRWLIYLPPTMAPSGTSSKEGYLEYPQEAFNYYREAGVNELVCEEKHMGSRAVIVLCRTPEVAKQRFGISGYGRGVIYTRTGRSFFDAQGELTHQILDRLDQALQNSKLWNELNTDWIALDAEILPWSAKSSELLKRQYIPSGTAAAALVQSAKHYLQQAVVNDDQLRELNTLLNEREKEVNQYIQEYQHYCWPVQNIDDIHIAPFQILAYEGRAAVDESHYWHLGFLDKLHDADQKLFKKTARCYVDLSDETSEAAAAQWWEDLTTTGKREGMVIKPLQSIVQNSRGLVQPAMKCRGKEYLRIIYGPTYTEPANLQRLRKRGLGKKYALALKEFVLGYESLHRFVEYEPLYKVHECAFGVLALESEPVDPRL